jgi:hypothetical protein
VVFFGIVGSISVEPSNRQVQGGLGHGGDESWGIVAGPQARLGRGDQMSGMVTDDGQLGETAKTLHPALASQEVPADVVALQPGGVNRGFGPSVNQAVFPGSAENNR